LFHIAEFIEPEPEVFWAQLQQMGVTNAVGTLVGAETAVRNSMVAETVGTPSAEVVAATDQNGDYPWDLGPLTRIKEIYEDAGFTLAVLEDNPPLDRVRLGLDGRDQEIEWFCSMLENMGKLEIPVVAYNFMCVRDWIRTSVDVRGRGGALTTEYDHSVAESAGSLDVPERSDDEMWDNLKYFLERVVPVAEASNVRLALHPDDPPLSPVQGMCRIIRSVDAFQRAIDLVPSPSNGLTLCQGNTTMMTSDLPGVIRRFGEQEKIFFVHFRDVRGTPEKFVETFHDEGQTDMLACMRAYQEVGFEGVMRSDHGPTLDGDSQMERGPGASAEDGDVKPAGYSTLSRLFAVGYMTGLREAACGREKA
jgi:mannonate dehydratase